MRRRFTHVHLSNHLISEPWQEWCWVKLCEKFNSLTPVGPTINMKLFTYFLQLSVFFLADYLNLFLFSLALIYQALLILPQICTASAKVHVLCSLKQMQYIFAVIYETLSMQSEHPKSVAIKRFQYILVKVLKVKSKRIFSQVPQIKNLRLLLTHTAHKLLRFFNL